MQHTEYDQVTQPTTSKPITPLLTVRDFHFHLHGALGINAIRAAVREGRIRSVLIGERKRLIPASELTDWPHREIGRN